MGIFDWFKKEKFVLPPEDYQIKLVKEIEEKLKTAKPNKLWTDKDYPYLPEMKVFDNVF